MANETIGELAHHCGHTADVRKNIKGKLYLMCPHCGQLPYNLPGGQQYILENAKMYGPEGRPESGDVTESDTVTEDEGVEVKKINFHKEDESVTESPNVTEPEAVIEPEPVTEEAGYSPGYF